MGRRVGLIPKKVINEEVKVPEKEVAEVEEVTENEEEPKKPKKAK